MLTIQFTKKALKALERLPEKHRQQILEHVASLAEETNPQLTKIRHDRGLLLSRRAGEYRLYVKRGPGLLQILEIRKRNDAYR